MLVNFSFLYIAKLYKVMLNECVEWEAVDIANVFDITKYIPDAVKKVYLSYMHMYIICMYV